MNTTKALDGIMSALQELGATGPKPVEPDSKKLEEEGKLDIAFSYMKLGGVASKTKITRLCSKSSHTPILFL